MSIMLNIQSRVPPHDFGEKHPENPHGYVPKRSKNDFFWGELSNSGGPGYKHSGVTNKLRPPKETLIKSAPSGTEGR